MVMQGQNCVAMLTLPGRVYSMAQSGSRLVVATSGRKVLIYDLRVCACPLLLCSGLVRSDQAYCLGVSLPHMCPANFP